MGRHRKHQNINRKVNESTNAYGKDNRNDYSKNDMVSKNTSLQDQPKVFEEYEIKLKKNKSGASVLKVLEHLTANKKKNG